MNTCGGTWPTLTGQEGKSIEQKALKRAYIRIPKTKAPQSVGTGKIFHHYLQRLNTLTATTLAVLPIFSHLSFTEIAP